MCIYATIMSTLAPIYESSAFGPFIGVFFGFVFNYIYQSYKNNQDKNKYISMIKSEFGICICILEEDAMKVLPRDHWISAVNSGALKLFDVKSELEPLTTVYNTIGEHNNDIPTGLLWKDDLQLKEKRDLLLLELKKLKSEKWLDAKSWWQFWR